MSAPARPARSPATTPLLLAAVALAGTVAYENRGTMAFDAYLALHEAPAP